MKVSRAIENPELRRAVEHLKNEKIIRFDADIVRDTGYSKGVVSSYISGKLKASKDFEKSFEKAYDTELSDFKNVLYEQNKSKTINQG